MLEALRDHMDALLPQWRDKRLLLAVSGGVDSVTLAHLLKDLNCHLTLAHCNFQLRGEESDEDQQFVEALAGRLGLQLHQKRFDTQEKHEYSKGSIQMVARELRYNWFRELMESHDYDYLVTAHHADDDLETLLINLIRGTGLRGLTGINSAVGTVLRPLLVFDKERILDYAKEKGYYWREDSSNEKSDYLRNQLRQEVIPVLKRIKPQLLQTSAQTMNNLKGSQALVGDYLQLIENLVVTQTSRGIELSIEQLKGLPHPEQLLYELLWTYGFTAWNDVAQLMDAQSGKQVLSPTHRLIKDREVLILTPRKAEGPKDSFKIERNTSQMDHPLPLRFSLVDQWEATNAHTAFIDEGKLNYPLELRPWRGGDVFYPIGMKGRKKLSKYFKDEKLSLTEKENLWLLCNGEEIVWIIGYRMDERYKVSRETQQILKIEHLAHDGKNFV